MSAQVRSSRASLFKLSECLKLSLPKDMRLSVHDKHRAKADLETISNGQPLTGTVHTLNRFNPLLIEDAIRFILSSNNVGMISWGQMHGVTGPILFPSIIHEGAVDDEPDDTRDGGYIDFIFQPPIKGFVSLELLDWKETKE